jgi:protein O-GlcNAc transferase
MSDTTPHRARLDQARGLFDAGQLAEAGSLCLAIIGDDPRCADALHLLARVHARRGAPGQAAELVTRAIRAAPGRPDLHMSLANLLMNAGNVSAAAASYAAAAQLDPGSFEATANHGIALARLRRYAEAEAALQRALALKPASEPVLTSLAGVLQGMGRSAEAADAARRAVAADPAAPEAWTNLGLALHSLGQLADAAAACERAIAVAPGFAMAWYNLGHVLNDEWRADEARPRFLRAVELDPGYQPAWHAMLFNSLYDPAETEQTIRAAHERWSRTVGQVAAAPGPDVRPSGGPSRRPRIGYVSPDFRTHSCAAFLQPLFAEHDPAAVEVFAYSAVERPDAVTEWFRSHTPHWRNVHGLADRRIAELVRSDGIDILVDLAGHTLNQPLGAFALKPAPVQLAWLGYPATCGLPQIGFRLTDLEADPPGDADRHHVEQLVRLAGGFHCYRAPDDAPDVAPLPAGRNGCITFASFNNISKVTPEAVRAWARILLALPDARLLLKGKLLVHDEARKRLHRAFERAGVTAERVELRTWIPRQDNPLAAYGDADIALDTFPYNGTTTTFEALWMGVPVITLRGARHAARVGASILTHLGRPEWIADDTDSYVAAAIELASDLSGLEGQRRTLRSTLAQTTLCDARGFARKIETVYRALLELNGA